MLSATGNLGTELVLISACENGATSNTLQLDYENGSQNKRPWENNNNISKATRFGWQ